MEQRPLGRTGADVGVVGLGTWQLGGDWGDVDDDAAAEVLDAALDAGVTLFAAADVDGDGRSEVRIRKALAPRSDRPFVATKAGRRADPFEAAQYTPENLRAWIDRSRRNLGVDTLDLVQLHCPPPVVYSDQRVYDALDALVAEEAIAAYGVSVETVAEGMTALQHPGVQTIQVILNIFRRKPLAELLPAAAAAEVGILAAREVAGIAGSGVSTAAFALRWVIDQPGVTAVIPGARNVTQVRGNVAAATLAPLSDSQLSDLERLYDERIRALVHDRW